MTPNLLLLLQAILEGYTLPWGGDYGVAHRARVLENGLRLAEDTGEDSEVVTLFAVLHDSRRVDEATAPAHGPRAAASALSLRRRSFDLPDREFRLLHRACAGHTHERTHPDVTIRSCWAADRLDRGRVGITSHPSRLCSEAARRPEMIHWADGRASFGVVPDFVKHEWGSTWRGNPDARLTTSLTFGPPPPFFVSPLRCGADPLVDGRSRFGAVMAIRQSDAVEVKQSKDEGRGAFAREAIRQGEVF